MPLDVREAMESVPKEKRAGILKLSKEVFFKNGNLGQMAAFGLAICYFQSIGAIDWDKLPSDPTLY